MSPRPHPRPCTVLDGRITSPDRTVIALPSHPRSVLVNFPPTLSSSDPSAVCPWQHQFVSPKVAGAFDGGQVCCCCPFSGQSESIDITGWVIFQSLTHSFQNLESNLATLYSRLLLRMNARAPVSLRLAQIFSRSVLRRARRRTWR